MGQCLDLILSLGPERLCTSLFAGCCRLLQGDDCHYGEYANYFRNLRNYFAYFFYTKRTYSDDIDYTPKHQARGL